MRHARAVTELEGMTVACGRMLSMADSGGLPEMMMGACCEISPLSAPATADLPDSPPPLYVCLGRVGRANPQIANPGPLDLGTLGGRLDMFVSFSR